MIVNFKLSSNLFSDRIYIVWFKRKLQIGMPIQKNIDRITMNPKQKISKR